jgi:hypothetical protein
LKGGKSNAMGELLAQHFREHPDSVVTLFSPHVSGIRPRPERFGEFPVVLDPDCPPDEIRLEGVTVVKLSLRDQTIMVSKP